MSQVMKFREAHLKETMREWDDIVSSTQRLLHYDDSSIRALTYRLLSVNHMTRFYVLGGQFIGRPELAKYSYGSVHNPFEIMNFVSFFVGHEIIDDGDPAVGYYNLGPYGNPVLCPPGTKDAKAFFHTSHEVLSKTYRWDNTEHLNAAVALRILNEYERNRARKFHNTGTDDMDLRNAYAMVIEDRRLATMARELMGKR